MKRRLGLLRGVRVCLCPSTMKKAFQREVDALQASQQLYRQHGDSDGADRQRDPQEDQAVGHRGGQQDQHSQQAQDGACDLEDKDRVGDQSGAEPDQQGDRQRHRRGEDFQNEFHGKSLLYTLIVAWLTGH